MAVKTYLTSPSDSVTIASNNNQVFGSTGAQTVLIQSGVTGTVLDANVERIDVAGNMSIFKFVNVAGTGLQIQTSAGVVVATLGSLNQNASVAFADGSAALAQTATGFTLGGTAVANGATGAAAAVTPGTFDTTTKSGVTSSLNVA